MLFLVYNLRFNWGKVLDLKIVSNYFFVKIVFIDLYFGILIFFIIGINLWYNFWIYIGFW